MKIALISHVRHPIAAPFMGGMEAHSWSLAKALIERGHTVTLFAAGDSDPQFDIWPVLPEHYDARYPWTRYIETKILHDYLDDAFARAGRALLTGGFDVVHNNSLHRYPPRLARTYGLPMVTSLHIPPFDALHRAVKESAAPWSLFSVTSNKQVECWWPDGPPAEAHVAYNGIDLSLWPFSPAGDGSAVWAGRITPTKGTHIAVRAAARLGVSLKLFGSIEDQGYYDTQIAPLLSSEIVYGGHLSSQQLSSEFAKASVFLFTPMWNEPFGLIAIEAMACGLPVAALDMGAAREVIGEGGVFAVAPDDALLSEAIEAALRIPRHVPRNRAAQFGIDAMIDCYERLYLQATAQRPAEAPQASFPERELRVA